RASSDHVTITGVRPLGCAIVVAGLALARPSPAEELRDAAAQMERSIRGLRYEEAMALGDRALQGVAAPDRAQVGTIHRLVGVAAFLAGDEAQARAAFLRLLALDGA